MTSTNRQIKDVAIKHLGKIPEDPVERSELAQKIWDEVDDLLKIVEDAQWSGDTERVKALRYPIMVKKAMFRIVRKRPRR